MSNESKSFRSWIKRLFYVKYVSIAEGDGKGNIIKPSTTTWYPRFKWVGPFRGWRDGWVYRDLSGDKWWQTRWGLMLTTHGVIYVSFNHWLKWRVKYLWCYVTHGGHDRGGMFWSCSRCGQ